MTHPKSLPRSRGWETIMVNICSAVVKSIGSSGI